MGDALDPRPQPMTALVATVDDAVAIYPPSAHNRLIAATVHALVDQIKRSAR